MTVLEVRSLCKAYGNTPVLGGVSFNVERGEFVGIIGPSGSGKSTLLRCINRLVTPDAGEILLPCALLGLPGATTLDVAQLGSRQLRLVRRRIGMIFQQFNLVRRLSVLDNVLSGGLGYQPSLRSTLRAFSRDQRARALLNLKRVGLLEHAYKRADMLSGGEQQRVAIARTLMQEPAIILADEPVSSLDPRLSRVVLDVLKRVCREDGITALVSLHTLEMTRGYADRVIGLRGGRVVFDGGPAELSEATVEAVYHAARVRAGRKL